MKQGSRTLFDALDGSATYSALYASLGELREAFHRSGRLDDSNSKLDEVVKIFATYIAFRLGDVADFPERGSRSSPDFVKRLVSSFANAAKLPCFTRQDGQSIFGPNPSLELIREDGPLISQVVDLVSSAVDDALVMQENSVPYDVLNESFGHFVRDNFRGNIEDAQYLTPPEVVDFMVELAYVDLEADGVRVGNAPLIVADPCCGVGSFLAGFGAKYRPGAGGRDLRLVGQDKVERMVRIATVNLALFRVTDYQVTIGNSLYLGSPLDLLNGQVDIILTNPPFGARFNQDDVVNQCGSNTRFFSSLKGARRPFDSELLFVDRNLELLKEGGRLYIVVPDSVISASGVAALLRHNLKGRASVEAVIDLPSVAFAQAGTRTRTAVLSLKKTAKPQGQAFAFLGICKDLGFQVSSRKGVQVKEQEGRNDLVPLLDAYRHHGDGSRDLLASDIESLWIRNEELSEAWTPGRYFAAKQRVGEAQSSSQSYDVRLGDIVEWVADNRRSRRFREGVSFISVLHIVSEGVLDFASMRKYQPITPGTQVYAGEILLSRINPRIPRVLVVPDLGREVLCSGEFEVMKPISGIDSYLLAFLLHGQYAQSQIQRLTSGTSASHSRIKRKDLSEVRIQMPPSGTTARLKLEAQAQIYKQLSEAMNQSLLAMVQLRANEEAWLQ